jgi:hypothetical protein
MGGKHETLVNTCAGEAYYSSTPAILSMAAPTSRLLALPVIACRNPISLGLAYYITG